MLPCWQDELIRIEPLTLADVDLVYQLRNDPEAGRYIDREPFASRDEAVGKVQSIVEANANGSGCSWRIVEKSSATTLGTGGIWRIDREHDHAEIGYAILPAFWGKGYARRALAPMFDHGFASLTLHRIEAHVHPDNARSSGLLLRLGFKLEGHLRENYKFRGKYSGSLIYGLLNNDWQKG